MSKNHEGIVKVTLDDGEVECAFSFPRDVGVYEGHFVVTLQWRDGALLKASVGKASW